MQLVETGTVTSPQGFKAAGVAAGIKPRGRPDLAIILSDAPAVFAGAFTDHALPAAAVRYDRELFGRAETVRAIVVNSGNANSCTGAQGMTDTLEMAAHTAEQTGIASDAVIVSSTGVIGVPLPMDRIRCGITAAAAALAADGGSDAAAAIMTTDTVPKFLAATVDIDGVPVTIGGITKGAGMIAPKLIGPMPHATMLAYMTTDAAIAADLLQSTLEASLDESFNRITVDGDRSTNDTFIALANGMAANQPIQAGSAAASAFQHAFNVVAAELARMIVRDGEGATRFVQVRVAGAASRGEAKRGAHAIANSMLCKTAWFGGDPNWGRILDTVGYAGIAVDPDGIDMDFDDVAVVRGGVAAGTPQGALDTAVSAAEFRIDIDLGVGRGAYTVWTCDLSCDYVNINAEHHT